MNNNIEKLTLPNFNFSYDQLTEEFICELDDKTVLIISGGNRGIWAQFFNSKAYAHSNMKNYDDILRIRFDSDAGDNITILDYLKELLITLWVEKEGFSGKRPFGNSGWEFDLYKPLIQHGYVKGSLDEDGYIENVDTKEANKLVLELIKYVFTLK